MIKNESFDEKFSYGNDIYQPKRILKLIKPHLKKDKIPLSTMIRNANIYSLQNYANSNSFNSTLNITYKKTNRKNSYINNSMQNKNKDSLNTKLIISKYLNKSSSNERTFLEQSSLRSKNAVYKTQIKFAENIPNSKYISSTYGAYEKKKPLILNMNNKNSLLKKIRKKFLKNKDYKDVYSNFIKSIEYKKKIKSINSSFSQESIFNPTKKIIKDFSSKNFLYNESIFNDSKEFNSSNNNKLKLIPNKKKSEHSCQKLSRRVKIPKYDFILNPKISHKGINIEEWKEKLEKMHENVEKVIEKSLNSKQVNHFSLIDKKKFSKKYQSINIYDEQKNIHEVQIKDRYKELINEDIYKDNLRLLAKASDEADKLNEDTILMKIKENQKTSLNNKRSLKEKLRSTIIKISTFLKQRNISENDLRDYKLIDQSFTYPDTEKLINAIKVHNFHLCCKIIEQQKSIVLDFDYFYLTPLHWAVKSNFYRILPALLDFGSIVDACSFSGETPLHISVRNNYYDCACILLYYLASPFIKTKDGKKAIELTNDFDMKNLLNKIMKLYFSSYFGKSFNQADYIQSGLWVYIREEFKDKINKEVFDYFNSKQIKDIFTLQY